MSKFEVGATVYTPGGHECEYVAPAGAKHIVRYLYETEQGSWAGDEKLADAVFSQPPTEKLHAEVAELEAQTATLREQLHSARAEVRNVEATNARRMKELAKLAPLARLEDFIAGNITHCLIRCEYRSTVSVVTFKDAMEQRTEYGRTDGMKLLSLFGKSNGDLAWRRNHYYDGSGSWTECEPFCSEEDANDRARGVLRSNLAACAAKEQPWNWGELFDCCDKFGVEVPTEMRERQRAWRTEAALKAVADASAKLEQAQASLAELDA